MIGAPFSFVEGSELSIRTLEGGEGPRRKPSVSRFEQRVALLGKALVFIGLKWDLRTNHLGFSNPQYGTARLTS